MTAVTRPACVTILTVLCVCVASFAYGREKTDEITLANGSFIIGEVKSLEVGMLEVSTDDMGTVQIEWVAVQRIRSSQLFDVDTADGESHTGALSPGDASGTLTIEDSDRRVEVALLDVVRIAELGRTFWDSWSGHVDVGVAYGSANSQYDVTVDAETVYTAEDFKILNALTGTLSDRDKAERTSRGSLTSTYQRTLRERWFWLAAVDLSRNEELALDMRAGLIGAYGRYVSHTSRSRLALAGGLSANREKYFSEDGEWNLEGLLAARYELFLFEGRETSFTTTLSTYPSLTTSGRYRVEFTSSLRRKLVRDFTLSLTLEESYDSKPPDTAIEKSDLRFRTTLGWSF